MPRTVPHAAATILFAAAAAIIPAASAADGAADQPVEARPIAPDAQPSPAPAAAMPHGAELLREGAFLSRVRGEMRRLSSGRWAFVFNPDVSGKRLLPMILLPCMNLAAMEQIVESREDGAAFSVSGQVFVYRGRNYLMPTMHAYVAPDEPAPPADKPADAPAPPAPEDNAEAEVRARAPGAEPTVEDLIRELEEATPQRTETTAPAPSEGADPGLAREGAYIVNRRGRVTRAQGADLVFVIDNGPDADANVDPPMTLLPSLALGAIERVIQDRSDELAFVISGRVYVYKGRNYLLPTMHQVDPDRGGNLIPAQ